jgi:hypothetical protein
MDEFCLFYLYWVDGKSLTSFTEDYWVKKQQTPEYRAWSGYTFESVCLSHRYEITRALNIQAAAQITSWRYIPTKLERGAQIDLVIDRDDDAITLCEIKYTDAPFSIDKSYAQLLERKIDVFKKQVKTEKLIFMALISSNGLKENVYSEGLIYKIVTLKDLFKRL